MLRLQFLPKRRIECNRVKKTVERTLSAVVVNNHSNTITSKTENTINENDTNYILLNTKSNNSNGTSPDVLNKDILKNKTFYLKTYGCQMNLSDSDIIRSILNESNMIEEDNESKADVILTNTCAIREKD